MAIGKSIVDVLKSITGKNVETIADGLEEALSGGGSGGGGVLIVTATLDDEAGTSTLNKTWQEIHDADFAVIYAEFTDVETGEFRVLKYPASTVGYENNVGYFVNIFDSETMDYFCTESSDGYPMTISQDSGGGGGD